MKNLAGYTKFGVTGKFVVFLELAGLANLAGFRIHGLLYWKKSGYTYNKTLKQQLRKTTHMVPEGPRKAATQGSLKIAKKLQYFC